LTDFWRVGKGYASKLEQHGLYTMGDIARCSVGQPSDYYNEDLLYKLFGVNAELLIDHAWGWEPCTIADIKAYKPAAHSLGSGQVLQCPYDFQKTKLVVREMTELLVLDLVDKRLVTDQIVLTIGYDIENLSDSKRRKYKGAVTTDRYGRKIPKHAHGTQNLAGFTSSTKQIMAAVMALFDRIVDPDLLVRRVTVVANRVIDETSVPKAEPMEQLSLFSDSATPDGQQDEADAARERRMQETMLTLKKKFGKNAILKGMNLEEGATTLSRNKQIGGHKA
jgi:DNA polymerase V